jgi:atrial natriuretic peptide receptor A
MADESVGNFVVTANYFGYRKAYEEVTNITWPGPSKLPPLNRPKCGFIGDDPICQEKRTLCNRKNENSFGFLFNGSFYVH